MNTYITILLWITYLLSLYFSLFFLFVFFERKLEWRKPHNAVKLPNHPLVSIIIPAHNEGDFIIRTLRSVLALRYPHDKLEVIVVDDGSTDHTKELVKKFIAGMRGVSLISHPNRGKAASLNRALGMAHGEFFVCLDADSVVEPNALVNMLTLYYADSQKLCNLSDSTQNTYTCKESQDIAIITPVMKVHEPRTLLQRVQWIEYLVMVLISRIAGHLDCLYVAPGPFSLYRTDIIRKLGGFDERSITEDQEIAYRVQMHHYRIKHCPAASVYTAAPADLWAFFRQRRRWYRGSIACLSKYRSLILNRAYGDFGFIQMLKNSLGFFLALSGISFSSYFIFWPVIEKLYHLSLVGFDIWPYIEHITLTFTPYSLDIQKVFIVGVLFMIGMIFFVQAHRNANEKVNKFGMLPIIPYFFLYYLLKGIILFYVIIEYGFRRKHIW